MASKDYLFVNKDSRSPSLSRNTGTEASLASRVNKHVQQQRFWKASGPRRNWYRPFVRSDSSSSAPSPARSDTPLPDDEDTADPKRRSSHDKRSPRLTRRSLSLHSNPGSSKPHPRSLPQEQRIFEEDEPNSVGGRWLLPPELASLARQPGCSPDTSSVCTIVVPLTPLLTEVIQKQLRWAFSASISDYIVRHGVKQLVTVVLQDKMHAVAFLAMATAQQRRIDNMTFPYDQSPELYSYRATKLIREHLEIRQGRIPPMTIVDIFRLAMCEWISGNHQAARIHISYISQSWNHFDPSNAKERDIMEICSTEDLFLAIDVDDRPLLGLIWELDLHTHSPDQIPRPETTHAEVDKPYGVFRSLDEAQDHRCESLETLLQRSSLPLAEIMSDCFSCLHTLHQFGSIDFGSALTGPLWVMKRRMHATLHRLQSFDTSAALADDAIRRTLVILLLLASSTPARRVARTDMGGLASRLQAALNRLEANRKSRGDPRQANTAADHLKDPLLWMWMYTVGLSASEESPSGSSIREWFLKRALCVTIHICGHFALPDSIKTMLARHLYFDNALARTVEELSAAIALRSPRRQTSTYGVED